MKEHVACLLSLLTSHVAKSMLSCLMLIGLAVVYRDTCKDNLGFRYAGRRFVWEPSFVLRLRFVLGAGRIIQGGYAKVDGPLAKKRGTKFYSVQRSAFLGSEE